MRVALAVEQLRRAVPGGIGTYARELSRALARSGVPVELVSSRPPHRPDPLATIAPVRATRLPHRITSELWQRDLLRLDRRVARSADVVHATSFHYPAPARRGAHPPYTAFVHDVAWRSADHLNARGVRFHERALARTCRDADVLLVPSTSTADALVRDGVDASRLVVIPEGCDHLPTPTGTIARGRDVVSVSTIEPRKNLGRLIEAWTVARRDPAVRDRVDRLIVVGATNWRAGAAALPASLPPDVELRVDVDDRSLADLLAGAHAFAYVPLLEGFGLPPLEAMRAGVPCVVSDTVPSIAEPGAPGDAAARLVDPLDVADIARGLVSVITDDALRVELQVRAGTLAATRTWAAAAGAHLAQWAAL